MASTTSARGSSLEVARLAREAPPSKEIVVATWRLEPGIEEVRRLGIPYLTPSELACAILERSGLPRTMIRVLPHTVDGTESEIAAVAEHIRATGASSVTLVTLRSHTARARWLLQREVGPAIHVSVRASRFDEFTPKAWWTSRDQSREVMSEYLPWGHSVVWTLRRSRMSG